MELLEGVMAFAVVMIILSTIVTGMTEACLRILAMRQDVLAKALKAFVGREVAPVFRSRLRDLYDIPDGADEVAFVADLTMREMVLNPLLAATDRAVGDRLRRLGWWERLNHGVEKLTTYSMLRRLAKTELGAEIGRLARSEQRRLLTDVSRTYERYVAASNEHFRKNAHMATAAIALALCFSANVSAGAIFEHLMNNADARASLIERADAVAEDNAKQVARLEALQKKIDEGGAVEGYELSELKALSARFDAPMTELIEREALPMGWDEFPYADGSAGSFGDYAAWVANVLAAAALVSLGGPFWYRVFASLSSLAQVVRSIGGGGRSEVIESGSADQPASARAAGEDITVTFETALPVHERRSPAPDTAA